MDFRCGARNGSSELFFGCQHGEACVVDAVRGEVCSVCQPGWEHDFYGFGHFYNCADCPDDAAANNAYAKAAIEKYRSAIRSAIATW